MLQRHIEVINAVVPENKINSVLELVKIQFNDLSNILRGLFLIKDTSPKIIDTIVSYGESVSSIIVANTIEDAVHFESKNFIKTIHQFDKHVIEKSQNPTCIEIDLLERAEEILKAIYLNNLKESKENKS